MKNYQIILTAIGSFLVGVSILNGTAQQYVYFAGPENELGCAVSDTITINVQPVGNVFFPNAFTPNGDGRNDVFAALGANVKTYELRIYNRWGEKVFETNNFLEGWNGDFKGSAQPVAVYVYYASVTLMNNITQKFKGSLTLIR